MEETLNTIESLTPAPAAEVPAAPAALATGYSCKKRRVA